MALKVVLSLDHLTCSLRELEYNECRQMGTLESRCVRGCGKNTIMKRRTNMSEKLGILSVLIVKSYPGGKIEVIFQQHYTIFADDNK